LDDSQTFSDAAFGKLLEKRTVFKCYFKSCIEGDDVTMIQDEASGDEWKIKGK